jgi:hypothetical protein
MSDSTLTLKKTLTSIILDVEVSYRIFPPEEGFPLQIEVERLTALTTNPVTGQPRRVNVRDALTESQILEIEDHILETANEIIEASRN